MPAEGTAARRTEIVCVPIHRCVIINGGDAVNDRTLLQHELEGSQHVIMLMVDDISDEDAQRMPSPVLSPMIWQAGHLAVANVNFMRRAGMAPATSLPAHFPDLFKGGTGGKAEYPPLSAVRQALDDTHHELMRVVAEANLDTPNEGPRGTWTNYVEMFAFANAHRWYHIGKMTSLRALLGKPRVFG
jgi:DinB superfamily